MESPLPLPLQLSIPFLSAGELPAIASLSKAASLLARASYRQRIREPLRLPENNNDNKQAVKVYLDSDSAPQFYKEAWWRVNPDHYVDPHWEKDSYLVFGEDARTWELQTDHPESRIPFRKQILTLLESNDFHFPKELSTVNSQIRHCSLMDNVLLVVATVKRLPTTRQEDSIDNNEAEYDEYDENIVMDIWSFMYKVMVGEQTSTTTQERLQFEPFLVQRLLHDIPQGHFANDYWRTFACASRSSNGNTLSVLSKLPNMDQYDNCEIEIFSIDSLNGLKQKHRLVVPYEEDHDEDALADVSLSSCGQFVSIRCVYCHLIPGSWSVYDLRGVKPKLLFHFLELGDHYQTVVEAYFTPDNEFVMVFTDVEEMKEFFDTNKLPMFCRRIVAFADPSRRYS